MSWPIVVALLGIGLMFCSHVGLRLVIAHRERMLLGKSAGEELALKVGALLDRMTALENRTGRR